MNQPHRIAIALVLYAVTPFCSSSAFSVRKNEFQEQGSHRLSTNVNSGYSPIQDEVQTVTLQPYARQAAHSKPATSTPAVKSTPSPIPKQSAGQKSPPRSLSFNKLGQGSSGMGWGAGGPFAGGGGGVATDGGAASGGGGGTALGGSGGGTGVSQNARGRAYGCTTGVCTGGTAVGATNGPHTNTTNHPRSVGFGFGSGSKNKGGGGGMGSGGGGGSGAGGGNANGGTGGGAAAAHGGYAQGGARTNETFGLGSVTGAGYVPPSPSLLPSPSIPIKAKASLPHSRASSSVARATIAAPVKTYPQATRTSSPHQRTSQSTASPGTPARQGAQNTHSPPVPPSNRPRKDEKPKEKISFPTAVPIPASQRHITRHALERTLAARISDECASTIRIYITRPRHRIYNCPADRPLPTLEVVPPTKSTPCHMWGKRRCCTMQFACGYHCQSNRQWRCTRNDQNLCAMQEAKVCFPQLCTQDRCAELRPAQAPAWIGRPSPSIQWHVVVNVVQGAAT